MGLLDRLKKRLRRRTYGPILPPDPLVDRIIQVREANTYAPAGEAAPWSDDITRHNEQVAKDWADEVARRETLKAEGRYVGRSNSVELDMMLERRTNVTQLPPRLPLLTREEIREVQTLTGLRRDVAVLEDAAARVFPTDDEVLAAAGGDAGRAAQVLERLRRLRELADAEGHDDAA